MRSSLARLAAAAGGGAQPWGSAQILERLAPAVAKPSVSFALVLTSPCLYNLWADRLGQYQEEAASPSWMWAARVHAALCQPAVQYLRPVFLQEAVAEHASGSYVTTSDGRKHLDVSGGVGRVCVYVLFFCFCWGWEGG